MRKLKLVLFLAFNMKKIINYRMPNTFGQDSMSFDFSGDNTFYPWAMFLLVKL